MAYCNADTSPKIGYRPYLQTDAHGAAKLSGMDPGLGQGSNPFKPYAWHLHGMGQLRPLDPWVLYPDNPIERLSGLGYLGDSYGNAGDDNAVAQAADELLSAGHITQAEHDAVLNGEMNFKDVLGYDPTDQASWTDLIGQAREANQALTEKEHEYAANAPPPGSPANPAYAAIGAQLIQMRQQYTQTTSDLVRYYTLVMGSAPTGLSGLGIAPIVYFVAGAIAFLVGAFLIYEQLKNTAASIDVQKQVAQSQQTEAQSSQQLVQQLQVAQAKGDTITAQSILSTLKARGITAPGGPTDFSAWFQKNFQWIALAGVAVVAAGPIAQGLFGGRRRR